MSKKSSYIQVKWASLSRRARKRRYTLNGVRAQEEHNRLVCLQPPSRYFYFFKTNLQWLNSTETFTTIFMNKERMLKTYKFYMQAHVHKYTVYTDILCIKKICVYLNVIVTFVYKHNSCNLKHLLKGISTKILFSYNDFLSFSF